ncbi:MAG: hypothetical protein F2934_10005 [Actinobacteria bacterium]|uniref:Unannotated protein n=1 Tax=freshwater metagenome TaxID=449393 RepID=A0A6J6U506_9ZZZZ|nr:hypothetical protein [Actinomycetota bacterium]MSY12927.1 hypothetical protein [Actinomycetota bacterium]MSZ04018.1 hypothetical protein [Actinomycetota bacterium]MTB07446.1 hypothetical protein [Actinomycetota bacterium]
MRNRLLTRSVLLLVVLIGTAACVDVGDPAADTIAIVDTEVPTTMLDVGFLDVVGLSYCEVIAEVAPDVRVWADPGSDFGDPSSTRNAYVGALRSFDAIAQVAPETVRVQSELLRRTLDDVVRSALETGWDVTEIRSSAGGRVDADEVATALGDLRRDALEQCGINLVEPEEPTAGPLDETPQERIRRVLLDLFPDLDDRKLDCLEPRLPLDFDPASEFLDPKTVTDAFAGCRIDLADPGAPTSAPPRPFVGPRPTTPVVATVPTFTVPEVEPPSASGGVEES